MLRIHLVVLLGLSLVMVAQGDDPKPKIEPKPQWQRLLADADAKKASDLEKRIEELAAVDNYAEAIRQREILLALRSRVQGAEHWQTENEKWALIALKKVAALPEAKRAGWREMVKGEDAAESLQVKAEYGEALALWRNQLKWCQEVVGEEHRYTVASYCSIGSNLLAQGKSKEANPLYQKGLDIARKVLGEEHPDTATCYDGVALSLNAQAKYEEAGALFQKALNIRRKILGEEHSHTAASYNNVAYVLKVRGKYDEAAPLFQKALEISRKVLGEENAETATNYNNVADNLNAQGKYWEAGPLFQKALDITRKVQGEVNSDTAASYNNVAANLQAQGKYEEAGPLHLKALDIRRKIYSEEHAQTAQSYNNLAYNLKEQGKYREAGPLFQKALDIYRKVLGEDHPETATSYNNLAGNLMDQGKYAEAESLYRKALDINRRFLGEENPITATSYNNLAVNLMEQEKYPAAERLYQKAMDIRRKFQGENHPLTADSYNNAGTNLMEQGKIREAGPQYQRALDIRRKILGEEHPDTANSYHNVAANLNAQRKYGEAELLYQKALDIRRKVLGEKHPQTVANYNSRALNFQAQGKYPEALGTLETAARSYEAARLSVATGLERATFGAEHSPYPFLATALCRAGRPADAWAALEADLARGLLDEIAPRQSLTPAEQRHGEELRAKQSPLAVRIVVLASQPQRTDAETAELERLVTQRRQLEKALAELAVQASRREVASLAQFQAALPADAALVAWVDVNDNSRGVQEHWGCVVRSQGEPHWERLPGSGPRGEWIPQDTNLTGEFHAALARSAPAAIADLAKRVHAQRLAPLRKHLDGVKRLLVVPVNRMASIPVEALTDQYTISYTPSGTYLTRFKDRQRPKNTGLLAVGDPIFLPFKDTPSASTLPPGGLLITQVLPGSNAARARLQIDDVLVAYAGQNLTSLEQLGKLVAAKTNEKTIIVNVWRDGQEKLAVRELAPGGLGIALAKTPAREALLARRQSNQLLAQVNRWESYAELPGTQVEIARLAELFDAKDVTTLTRAAASEQQLDVLRKADKLKLFRYLHFATHGKANNVRSFESALILTPPAQLPEVRVGEPYLEGRLTAREVLQYWHLDAELVTLSACESGLGRRGGGDGLLGFAQAFLMAGSRSVCLTLWEVDDTATALLMDRFYRNLLGKHPDRAKPMGKAAALREAKDWLRNVQASEALVRLGKLTQGEVRGKRPAREEMPAVPKPKDAGKDYRPYAHPHYWAAFILIGDPE